ncbi:MAG TPA: TlyA family RNA methyltransferase [Candidatus Acidoferrales bacterium]|nr:TlyA family RNA methyltransferase [Candidatus Acidoferrales bacterium]
MTRSAKAGRIRLDRLLVERGLAETRARAQALILAGQVLVEGERGIKAGAIVKADARVELAGQGLKYASRGGLKLEGALEDFGIDCAGRVVVDVGSSTGGFVDCLLQRGARRVYAVDVNTAQLDWRLRRDERVVLVERNARYLRPEEIPESADLVTVDVSFISATKVLPAVEPLARPGAEFLILVKPQFELERGQVGRGGIVRDTGLRQRAVERVRAAVEELGLATLGVKPSRVAGAEGNQEFFLHARKRAGAAAN